MLSFGTSLIFPYALASLGSCMAMALLTIKRLTYKENKDQAVARILLGLVMKSRL